MKAEARSGARKTSSRRETSIIKVVQAPRTPAQINEVNRFFWQQVRIREKITGRSAVEAGRKAGRESALRETHTALSRAGVEGKLALRADRDRWVRAHSGTPKQIKLDLAENKSFPKKLRRLSPGQIRRIRNKPDNT